MYLRYLKYLIKHKWYVMLACFRAGLVLQGLVHDLSKFCPDEFIPYAKHFFGSSSKGNHKDNGDFSFDLAWLLHQRRNKHHWQWWVMPNSKGDLKALSIPTKYFKEMLCDWLGAAQAQGSISPKVRKLRALEGWWVKHRDTMVLHPATRRILDLMLVD